MLTLNDRQAGNRAAPIVFKQSHPTAQYQKVVDGRKRPIRGVRFGARATTSE